MRQRLVQVLSIDDQDPVATEVLRRFWARAKPLSHARSAATATVVDLALWARARRDASR